MWRHVGLGVLVVTLLAVLARISGVSGLLAGAGGLTPSSLAVVVVIGLAAGFSTCMALVGGLVLAVAARHAQQHPDASALARLRPQLAFNVGRVIGFGVLGALLGAVGSALTLGDTAVGGLLLLAAAVLVVLGARLTGISPRLAGAAVTLPPGLARALHLDARGQRGYSDRNTALLGALTFFLPCGFTQVVQLFALSTGRPATAAAVMALFALGTAPGLLGLGGLTALARGRAAQTLFAVAGVAVLAFAFVDARAGLTNLGIRFGGGTAAATAEAGVLPTANVVTTGGVQQLSITQGYDGYSPASSVVYAGTPVRWVVHSTAPLSCPAALRAPAIGVSATLHEGDNVFEFTPQQPGTIEFHCAMGMYSGEITAVPRPAPAPARGGSPTPPAQAAGSAG